MTRAELARHLRLLRIATQDDLDELLADLLATAWRSRIVQNN